MSAEVVEQLRDAAVFIPTPEIQSGSGYLIAPGRIATAWHVVKSWQAGQTYEVKIGSAREPRQARLLAQDQVADAAILGFDEPVKATPLPVAKSLDRKAAWTSYGFPAIAKDSAGAPRGLPLDGHVQDLGSPDDRDLRMLVLYSEMIAAGHASPLHGFSGSPVLVDGGLIGHVVRHIGDPDDRRRAAFGFVLACPIDTVVRLLGKDHSLLAREVAPKRLAALEAAVPDIAEYEYHVFVSYRSTDREWALSLVDRLNGAGLRVFLDQRELAPGEYLTAQLESAITRSSSAVVLVSRSWLESPWCQQEASALVQRAIERPEFRVLPLRLDDAQLPPFLGSRLWLDFRGTERAEGQALDSLLDALLDRAASRGMRVEQEAVVATREVTDEYVQHMYAAAAGRTTRVLELVEEWRRFKLDDQAPLIAAADVLLGKSEYDHALALLEPLEQSVRVRQLRALILSKKGTDKGIVLLEAMRVAGHTDAETLGLLAGCYKRRWNETKDSAYLRKAYEIYSLSYEQWRDSFNGINTAALALQLNDRAVMSRVASEIEALLTQLPRTALNHWERASLGEAYLLMGEWTSARQWYGHAVAACAGRVQDIAVMRRQARQDLGALGKESSGLDDILCVPKVLAYVGHMVDARGRAEPRFPPSHASRVSAEIRDRLQKLGAFRSFGSAAAGSDLLFLRAIADHHQQACVLLPCPEAHFVPISVGPAWCRQFETVRASKEVTFLPPVLDHCPSDTELPEALSECNRQLMDMAIEAAQRLDEKVTVIAVWDGKPGDGVGGTADAVEMWRAEGYDVQIINPMAE